MISSQNHFSSNLAQPTSAQPTRALTREARLSWIGSKLVQVLGVEDGQLDDLHHRMWMRILQSGLEPAAPRNETDQMVIHILAVATLADDVASKHGPQAAMAAVMQASGHGLEPLLAENFLRLASSPIFWLALRSDGVASV